MDPRDKEIACVECKKPFIFTAAEQEFYREKELSQPKRCSKCREAKKARFES